MMQDNSQITSHTLSIYELPTTVLSPHCLLNDSKLLTSNYRTHRTISIYLDKALYYILSNIQFLLFSINIICLLQT